MYYIKREKVETKSGIYTHFRISYKEDGKAGRPVTIIATYDPVRFRGEMERIANKLTLFND